MFTLFTIPKAFKRHIGVIQRNVIGSWAQLARSSEGRGEERPEILLFGRDEGTAEVARELGLRQSAPPAALPASKRRHPMDR